MSRILALATIVAWALACSSASASTVTATRLPLPDGSIADRLTVYAGPGERNDVQITADAASLRVHDAAGVVAQAPCVAEDPQTGRCPLQTVLVELGDGDDRLTWGTGFVVEARGGDGDDTIVGGGSVNGGPGNDLLIGADGTDVLFGSGGDDRIEGRGGNDGLTGGDGNDVIDGGPGLDRITGDGGRDLVQARDGQPDVVFCTLYWVDGDRAVLDADDTQLNCTYVDRAGEPRLELHGVDQTGPRVLVSCPAATQPRACAGRVRVPGARNRWFRVPPGQRARLSVPLRRPLKERRATVVLRTGQVLRTPVIG